MDTPKKHNPKTVRFAQIFALSCIGLITLLFFLFPADPTPEPKPEAIVYNGAWDNEVWQVQKYLKSTLNDPDSYESDEWGRVLKQGDNYAVLHKYRAKNAFGGYVRKSQMFYLDSLGNVFNVEDKAL